MCDNVLYKTIFGLVLLALFMSQVANAAGPAAVNLGTAGDFAILSQAGISTIGTTSITGDIGVSPAAATYITGFSLVNASSNQYSTSSYVTGDVFAASYSAPTPAILTTAISNMQAAYSNAAVASTTNATDLNLASGTLNGQTLAPGVYTWGSPVTIINTITLSGGPNSVWIFQISGTLNVAGGAQIILTGGAQPQNIFWQVAGQTTLGTGSAVSGIILDKAGIAMQTRATLTGSALSQTAVTLQADKVIQSTGSGAVPASNQSTTTTPATTTTPVTPKSTPVPTTNTALYAAIAIVVIVAGGLIYYFLRVAKKY